MHYLMQFLWNSPHAKMETVYKKYNCLDLQDWWVDAGAIQGGSFCKAKESILSMDSLLRIQIEKKHASHSRYERCHCKFEASYKLK